MLDSVDAYIRESRATLEYASRNQYFRRILPNGLNGSLRVASEVINKAMASIADKMGATKNLAAEVDSALRVVAQDLSQSIMQLAGTAETMGHTVSATLRSTTEMVHASDQTSANVQTISAAAEELSASVGEISQQTSRVSDISNQAKERSADAQRAASALGQTTEKISTIAGMIDGIAKQTNMLALNATIEAARAGEAGRGFAVVASEVKSLAGQTGHATEEIAQNVAGIRSVSEETMQAFDEINRIITQINQFAMGVAAAVEEQGAASRDVAANAEHAAMGTQLVAEKVRGIGSEMDHINQAAQAVTTITQDLSANVRTKVEALLQKMDSFMVQLNRVG
jgi:methyl-accepting chemotaxis protein